jgi:hypothetical protein
MIPASLDTATRVLYLNETSTQAQTQTLTRVYYNVT